MVALIGTYMVGFFSASSQSRSYTHSGGLAFFEVARDEGSTEGEELIGEEGRIRW